MKRGISILWIGAAIGAIAIGSGYVGYRWAGRGVEPGARSVAAATDEAATPEVRVQVSAVREGSLRREITAYGIITIPPAELRASSVPFEAQVTGVLVAAGESVEEGQPLIEVKPSAATSITLEEARSALESTQRDLDLVKQRYDQHFATNTELNTAQSAANLARSRFQSMEKSGASGVTRVKATSQGIVARVDVQPGQSVPIGGPLVEVAPRDQVEARLGMEPGDADNVHPGMGVSLRDVQQTQPSATGTVSRVSRDIDPATRLRNLFVSLPPDARMTVGGAVVGTIGLSNEKGLIVPREALISGDAGQLSIFTISESKAVRHVAIITLETEHFAEITAQGVKPGDSVVVVGAEQLEDARLVIATAVAAPKEAAWELSSAPPEAATQPDAVTQPVVSDRGEP